MIQKLGLTYNAPALAATSSEGTPGILPYEWAGPSTASGQLVGPQQSKRAATMLACLRILSEDIAGLPCDVMRRTSAGAVPATDHPAYRLLKSSPNPWMTSFEMTEARILDMILFGYGYALKNYDSAGRLVALSHIPAANLQLEGVVIDPVIGADLKYRYSGNDGTRIYLGSQLWRTQMLSSGIGQGESIRLLAREAIGLLLAAQEQGARLFAHGIQSDLTVETEDNLTDDQREQLKKNLDAAYTGSANSFRPLILEGSLKVQRIGLTAQESQYIEARKYQSEEVARLLRIPGVMLGLADKTATYASAEQFFDSYVKFCLLPWLRRLEQSAERDILTPDEIAAGYFIRYNVAGLLRASLKDRYDSYSVGIGSGFLTRADARELEDLPAIAGLDKPTLPVNVAPVGQAQAFAKRLADNAAAHEAKLLSDGKPRADVYARLGPYLVDKLGLTAEQSSAYCASRLADEDATPESGGAALLKVLMGDPSEKAA